LENTVSDKQSFLVTVPFICVPTPQYSLSDEQFRISFQTISNWSSEVALNAREEKLLIGPKGNQVVPDLLFKNTHNIIKNLSGVSLTKHNLMVDALAGIAKDAGFKVSTTGCLNKVFGSVIARAPPLAMQAFAMAQDREQGTEPNKRQSVTPDIIIDIPNKDKSKYVIDVKLSTYCRSHYPEGGLQIDTGKKSALASIESTCRKSYDKNLILCDQQHFNHPKENTSLGPLRTQLKEVGGILPYVFGAAYEVNEMVLGFLDQAKFFAGRAMFRHGLAKTLKSGKCVSAVRHKLMLGTALHKANADYMIFIQQLLSPTSSGAGSNFQSARLYAQHYGHEAEAEAVHDLFRESNYNRQATSERFGSKWCC
jgi:hypothetical protein